MEENFKKKILKKLSTPASDYLKKKQPLNNENDPGEYDSEGSMAKSQLTSILNNAKEIKEMLKIRAKTTEISYEEYEDYLSNPTREARKNITASKKKEWYSTASLIYANLYICLKAHSTERFKGLLCVTFLPVDMTVN